MIVKHLLNMQSRDFMHALSQQPYRRLMFIHFTGCLEFAKLYGEDASKDFYDSDHLLIRRRNLIWHRDRDMIGSYDEDLSYYVKSNCYYTITNK